MRLSHLYLTAALAVALVGCDALDTAAPSAERGYAGTSASHTDIEFTGPVTYVGELSAGATEGEINGISDDITDGDLYRFCTVPGEPFTIRVLRLDGGLDPALRVYDRTGDTAEDFEDAAFASSYDVLEPNVPGPFFDPQLTIDPEVTQAFAGGGPFTLAVFGQQSESNDLYSYRIEAEGVIPCDGDGDGVPDAEDAFPDSDLSPTVVIDGNDTGVTNQLLATGATFNDLIGACADDAANHGEYVACVAGLTNGWVADDLISGRDKGRIMQAAAQAEIP